MSDSHQPVVDATNSIHHYITTIATGITLGTIIGWLPSMAAGFAMVLYGIQILESKTVQEWLKRRRSKK